LAAHCDERCLHLTHPIIAAAAPHGEWEVQSKGCNQGKGSQCVLCLPHPLLRKSSFIFREMREVMRRSVFASGTSNNNKNNSSSSGKAGKPRRKPHMPVVPVPSRPFTVDTQLQGRRSTSCLTHASPSSPHSPQPRFAQHAISRGRPHQMRASTAPTPEASAPLSPLGSPRKSSAVPPPSSSQRTLPVSHAGRRSAGRFLPTPQEGARRNAYGPPRRPMTVQRGVAIPMRPPLSIVEGARCLLLVSIPLLIPMARPTLRKCEANEVRHTHTHIHTHTHSSQPRHTFIYTHIPLSHIPQKHTCIHRKKCGGMKRNDGVN
jgi:hypothetical protein